MAVNLKKAADAQALAAAENLKTLYRAAEAQALAVVECWRRSDGKVVHMLCAIGMEGEDFAVTPFAVMLDGNGNPFELYDPPNPAGGFYSKGEITEGGETG